MQERLGDNCVETNKKRRGIDRLSHPWKLDLSAGYRVLKIGKNDSLIVPYVKR